MGENKEFRISENHNVEADGYKGSVHSETRGSKGKRYWYRFWRDHEGRQHRQYIRLADLERVMAGVKARQEFERGRRMLRGKERA